MYLEDVVVGAAENMVTLLKAYGHKGDAANVKETWDRPENAELAKRGDSSKLAAGDTLYVPIPWKMKPAAIYKVPGGVHIDIWRTGERGKKLSWVQTVYRDNQPIGPNPNAYCVDACTPDDNLPFYFTGDEIKDEPNLRKHFWDEPKRPAPVPPLGTTRWRAITSFVVVTGKRVTVVGSTTWGFNLPPGGVVTMVGPRDASGTEVKGHLALLASGKGTGGVSFSKLGWVFRLPPP
jgi:hypothetical protein